MTLSESVVLISGASSGIGQASATTLVSRGFRVFGTSRNVGRAMPLPGVEWLELDVSDEASVTRAVSEVVQRAGHIDVLVNNAGVGLLGAAEESSTTQAQQLFDVNFFGLVRLTNAVLPHMRQRRRGRIINMSSVLGFIPQPYMALYAATKHAVEGYSESLDHELREFGIRVSIIEPAYTRTSFEVNQLKPDSPLGTYDAHRAVAQALVVETQRNADEPDVVARAVLKAVTATRPALRYPAGQVARRTSLLRRFVPSGAFDNQIHRLNKLGSATRAAVRVPS